MSADSATQRGIPDENKVPPGQATARPRGTSTRTAAAPAADTTTPFPFPTAEDHDNPPVIEQPVLQDTSEDALDAGVEESFPASDPVSVTVTKVVPVAAKEDKKI
ncbi:MAG: hypothetical protein JWQ73_2279 [Variovorax sp.]|nr:hypothetical protein [Variovorax sp.]